MLPRFESCSTPVPSLHAGSQPRLVDAAPRRIDVQVKRDRPWLDLALPPLATRPAEFRFPETRSDAPALGPRPQSSSGVSAFSIFVAAFRA